MDYLYTQLLEDKVWEIASEWDETEDYSLALSFLNGKDSFRSFGEGLLLLMKEKLQSEDVREQPAVCTLGEMCDIAGIPISEIASPNTLSNWFTKGMRPKKGEASRNSMFAFAFALQLGIEETVRLFHNVYLDRAFNYRDPKEIVYYYCLKNKVSWCEAQSLIEALSVKSTVQNDSTQYTANIKLEIDSLDQKDAIVAYINAHGHNFEKDSVTATEHFFDLLHTAKKIAKQEMEESELCDNYLGKWVHREEISNNLLYEIMTGVCITGSRGTKTAFNNATLPKEIRNRFPEAATFSKKTMGPEERRKAIILLFSYVTWYKSQWTNIDYDLEDYVAQLDALLFECSYAKLYYGNPFDWLFLFCAQAERPLDMFRDTLQEVFEEDDQ